MAKTFEPQIVSANDLIEGDVVYLDAGREWTRRLADAAIARDEAQAQALLALADQPARVVGPCLVAVSIDDEGGPQPVHYRERFRERGPSVRPDLGRQSLSGVR
ncbi:MAG: DUF2849 domain-containing protein [Geminicoccaceae bacterium]|nr:DUF2849 domain-containing protein [Geminicoccaceae bacterium]